jgi:hypothetical protein
LGRPKDNIDPEWAQKILMDETIEALDISLALSVVDDVDSLEE